MSDVIIKVENLGKKYIISHEQQTRSYTALRDVISQRAKSVLKRKKQSQPKEEFWALKDVSFQIKKGEAVGIIGRNGAGKSTLLKILSRITEPTKGRIELNGRIASLLEVGTGFHPELTGRENVFLNGAILGMTRSEIRNKFDEIVDFAGVEKFLDTPVKRYSSGMYVRLAFAVAAHLEPEILVVDEVLAVGDAEFQKKCLGKMNDVSAKDGRTVLFVSHNMSAVQSLCSHGIYLKAGNVMSSGKIENVLFDYLASLNTKAAFYQKDISDSPCFIKSVVLRNSRKESANDFSHDEEIIVEFVVEKVDKNISDCRLILLVQDNLYRKIFADEILIESTGVYRYKINAESLVRGNYSLNCIIYTPAVAQHDIIEECCNFNIIDSPPSFAHLEAFDYGVVVSKGKWINIL